MGSRRYSKSIPSLSPWVLTVTSSKESRLINMPTMRDPAAMLCALSLPNTSMLATLSLLIFLRTLWIATTAFLCNR